MGFEILKGSKSVNLLFCKLEKAQKKHEFNFVRVKKSSETYFFQAQKHSKNMNQIFCKLQKFTKRESGIFQA